MARQGWILHTGLAEGADGQFCLGALENEGRVILHAPFVTYGKDWVAGLKRQFGSRVEVDFLREGDVQAFQMVKQYHPYANKLSDRDARFHACNYRMRVPLDYPPVLLTVALQGDRPQEQEFGYHLGQALSIPSILIRDLPPEEVKMALDCFIRRGHESARESEGKVVEITCQDNRDDPPPAPYQFLPTEPEEDVSSAEEGPDSLLLVAGHTATSLWREAQALTQQFRKNGAAKCPCCGQGVNLRTTTIDHGSARWLILLVRAFLENGRDWVYCKRYKELQAGKGGGGDYSKPKYWDLIETKSKRSGIWRPTEKGIAYVFNQIKIPSSCLTYNDKAYKFSSTEGSISEYFEQDPAEYARLVDGLEKLAYPER
jgi:hypothetical protein